MGDFRAAYPGYAATARLDELRSVEYGYLDEGGHVYLDYTGAGLPAQSQLLAHTARLRAGCYGNPHSDNPTSSASTRLIEQAREAVLRFFSTTAAEYAVIFTPNATRRQAPVALGVKMTAYCVAVVLKKRSTASRASATRRVDALDVGLSECGLP